MDTKDIIGRIKLALKNEYVRLAVVAVVAFMIGMLVG